MSINCEDDLNQTNQVYLAQYRWGDQYLSRQNNFLSYLPIHKSLFLSQRKCRYKMTSPRCTEMSMPPKYQLQSRFSCKWKKAKLCQKMDIVLIVFDPLMKFLGGSTQWSLIKALSELLMAEQMWQFSWIISSNLAIWNYWKGLTLSMNKDLSI